MTKKPLPAPCPFCGAKRKPLPGFVYECGASQTIDETKRTAKCRRKRK